MPSNKTARTSRRERTPRIRLRMPVAGMEAEFNVVLDGVEIDPRAYWGHPLGFIEGSLLPREKSSFQLPTGGAVYFDRGVIEVVTPVIELAAGCTARVVRNLWEGIGFVRAELTKWEGRTGHQVRLKGYSAHYNISYELPAAQQSRQRNVRSLALLLAHILPLPVALVGTNRRSTGVGVRPRGNRIEVTVDFTPDPGHMIATATLIVGIVREVLGWPSYSLRLLDELPIPAPAGVVPGKHTTRKGWLTKDFQYPQSPYTSDVDEPLFPVRDGRRLSLRQIGREVCTYFRRSIRRTSDPFSFRLLFAILEGRLPSLLELPDRPAAYDDVGRLCRWGQVIAELSPLRQPLMPAPTAITGYLEERRQERERYVAELRTRRGRRLPAAKPRKPQPRVQEATISTGFEAPRVPVPAPAAPRVARGGARSGNGRSPRPSAAQRGAVAPRGEVPRSGPALTMRWSPQPDPYVDRRLPVGRRAAPRRRSAPPPPPMPDRRKRAERRTKLEPVPFPDRRLTRSAYERVFLKLVSGGRLRIGRQSWTPVGMKGWYQAIFRNQAGRERLFTIDQLLKRIDDWEP